MVGSSLASVLILLASAGPEIATVDEARFRVTIRYDDLSVGGHTKAQVSLIKAAGKFCAERGQAAVSEGALELNEAEPLKRRKTLSLSEVYTCTAKR